MAKHYSYNGYLGCVSQQKNRVTGTVIGIYNAAQAQFDTSSKWYTSCEDHNMLCGHDTLKSAKSHASYPEWCEECQKLISGGNVQISEVEFKMERDKIAQNNINSKLLSEGEETLKEISNLSTDIHKLISSDLSSDKSNLLIAEIAEQINKKCIAILLPF